MILLSGTAPGDARKGKYSVDTIEIYRMLQKRFSEAVQDISERSPDPCLVLIRNCQLSLEIFSALKNDANFLFDYLMCMSGVDNGIGFDVVYHIFSFHYKQRITVRAPLSREDPEIASVSNLWRAADWFEREIYDMFGIKFTGHPDLCRILCPDDWEGFPLRKDYVSPEMYRGMRISYPGERAADE